MYYTLETLLNYVFEDVQKTKAPNSFLLENPEQTPLARDARVGVAHRRREET
jgi:hypothetical protein